MLDQSQPTSVARPVSTRMRRFVKNRLRELGYGTAFGAVFLLSQSPLNALVIEDIRVLSRLGEPLHAEIPVSAAAGEQLAQSCFSTVRSNGDLPGMANVRLALSRQSGDSVLTLRTASPMREPMSELVLRVRCPGVPTVIRTFMVMVDPPARAEALQHTMRSAAPATAGAARRSSPRNDSRRPAVAQVDPIAPGSRYTVRTGDMLSTIAARVEGRPDWSVWPLAQRIFAANPGAFLLGDPNMIAQGATIDIPALSEVDFDVAASASLAAGATAARPASTAAAAPGRDGQPARVTTRATEPAAVTRSDSATPLRIAPAARAMPPAVAIALPSMRLTAALSGESRMKLRMRRTNAPSAALLTGAPAERAATTPTPAETPPAPPPELPDIAATDQRAALPAQPRSAGWINWLAWLAGILVAFLLGGFVAAAVLRRRIKEQYDRDLSEALRLRERDAAPEPTAAPAPVVAAPAAGPSVAVKPIEVAPHGDELSENTVETLAISDLDLELHSDEPADAERASTQQMPTLDMPTLEESLDLELPDGKPDPTGQQEVDFDLLERAYSEAYESEMPAEGAVTTSDEGETAETEASESDERYYHLENRDPADEAPLPIELGEDEMIGDDPDDDSKVVRFPKHSSSG